MSYASSSTARSGFRFGITSEQGERTCLSKDLPTILAQGEASM